VIDSYCSILEKHVDRLKAANDVLCKQITQLEQQRTILLEEIQRDLSIANHNQRQQQQEQEFNLSSIPLLSSLVSSMISPMCLSSSVASSPLAISPLTTSSTSTVFKSSPLAAAGHTPTLPSIYKSRHTLRVSYLASIRRQRLRHRHWQQQQQGSTASSSAPASRQSSPVTKDNPKI